MSGLAKYLGGVIDIVPAFRPINLQDASGQHVTGDFVSLKNWGRCIILFHSAIGTAGEDPTLTLRQAKDNADGSGKTLAIIDTIYAKQAATDLLSTGVWVKRTQTAGATYVDTDSAEQEALFAIEVRAEDMDVDGGFDFLRLTVADVGSGATAQLGAAYYILCDPKYPSAPANVISPLS